MLWGNYVTAGASTRWLASEVPSNDPVFPNAVPSSQNLPASFYLSAAPNWWPSAKAWPPVGPDVSGGNISGYSGHAYTIPSQDCFSLSGNLSNFNPSVCYGSTPPTVPVITAQPSNQIVSVGETATFTVTASGAAPLSYQWQKNSVNISGATSASYTTPATVSSDSGATFRVIVSNSAGSVTSSAATLTVTAVVTDSDGDGLLDSWEIAYFGSISANPGDDPDGDGMTNLAEYLAGTIPTDPASRLIITSQNFPAPGQFQIQWSSVSGKSYEVQSSADMITWTAVATVPATSASTTWTDSGVSGVKKFYRVRIP